MLIPHKLYKSINKNSLFREYFDFTTMVSVPVDTIVLVLKHMPAGFVFAGDHVYEVLYDSKIMFLVCYDGIDKGFWELIC